MKGVSFCFLFILGVIIGCVSAGGGSSCAACTLVVGLVERYAVAKQTTIETAAKSLCDDLAPKVRIIEEICQVAFDFFVPTVAKDFANKLTPDQTCIQHLGLCKDWSTCSLYQQPFDNSAVPLSMGSSNVDHTSFSEKDLDIFKAAFEPLAPYIISGLTGQPLPEDVRIASSFFKKTSGGGVADHLPELDLDGDRFSTIKTLRGSDWRGKDCNDLDATIYPGRKTNTHDAVFDHNCNGIHGLDTDLESFEDKWCGNSQMRGVINLGDSATAHFRIPPQWFNGSGINEGTYHHLLEILEDEADWPQCSWGTGHLNASDCPPSTLPVSSIYTKLRERNLCNHRDYQNTGVNGASSVNSAPPNHNDIDAMKPRNGTDQPALIIYAMVGNDVCGHHHDFSHMTTPAEFEAGVIAALDWVDAHMAPDSHLVFVGLVDGRILYETMQDQVHPVGVKYPDFYNYLNCLQTSPCWGYMNTNSSVRDQTYAHAQSLNAVYGKIMNEKKYQNFKMDYFFPDFDTLIKKWEAQGGNPVDLIEPTDGFHPSQTGNMLLANALWSWLEANNTEAIGPVNPFNAQIKAKFGDQGGY